MTAPIQDLRDAIALLQQHDNQYRNRKAKTVNHFCRGHHRSGPLLEGRIYFSLRLRGDRGLVSVTCYSFIIQF